MTRNTLATCSAFDGPLLARAVQETFRQRQTRLQAMPAAFSPAFARNGAKQTQWQAFVHRLAEARAADLFSKAQLAHAERLAAEREKMERYYRQQEGVVAQIAIENIRLAKQRELLERRHADLAALDRRMALVPDLALVGAAILVRASRLQGTGAQTQWTRRPSQRQPSRNGIPVSDPLWLARCGQFPPTVVQCPVETRRSRGE
jgi:hypothetical protein